MIKMNFSSITIFTISLFTANFALSGIFYTGNELYAKLKGGDIQRARAADYIAGVYDALSNASKTICTNDRNINLEQLVDIVENYLTSNPETRDYSAWSTVGASLQKKFPCSKI